MKKPCQIEAQRAVKQFESIAADGNPTVRMMLPKAEIVAWHSPYVQPVAQSEDRYQYYL